VTWTAKPPQAEYLMLDESDSTAFVRFHMRHGTGAAAGQAAADSLRGLLHGVSGCRAVRQTIIYYRVPLATTYPPGGALAASTGVFIFADGAGERVMVTVPGILPAMLLTSGPLAGVGIDTTHPDVAALVAAIIGGPYTTLNGGDITTLNEAYMEVRP
jgi:hypothetical protein